MSTHRNRRFMEAALAEARAALEAGNPNIGAASVHEDRDPLGRRGLARNLAMSPVVLLTGGPGIPPVPEELNRRWLDSEGFVSTVGKGMQRRREAALWVYLLGRLLSGV